MKHLFFLLLLVSLVSSATVSLLDPVEANVGDAPVFLGVAGPGQTIELKFSRDTGVPAAINPTTGKNAVWDQANVIQSNLPGGWSSKNSLKYENPLTVFITVSPKAEKKEYEFSVGFVDELEGTPAKIAKFKVKVDPDVFEFKLAEERVSTGVGQPALFTLKAKSKSIASDTFVIKATGLPYDWQFSKVFFLPHNQEKDIFFEVIGNIQKEVPFEITVSSVSSEELHKNIKATVLTSSNLLQDAKAASLGLPLFPSIEQNIYALIGLLANLLFK